PTRAAPDRGHVSCGMLGNGTYSMVISTPVAVVGGLSFSAIALGGSHSCGLISSGAAYCWGANSSGQLGDGTTTGPQLCPVQGQTTIACSATPVAVSGGVSFSVIDAGTGHTSALLAR